jgi:hypothetical protein
LALFVPSLIVKLASRSSSPEPCIGRDWGLPGVWLSWVESWLSGQPLPPVILGEPVAEPKTKKKTPSFQPCLHFESAQINRDDNMFKRSPTMERLAIQRLLTRSVNRMPIAASGASSRRQLHSSYARWSDQVPTVYSREFWANLIPKPLRKSATSGAKPKLKSKEWNPATFYIFIFLFIGSMSINQLVLRTEYNAFTERADARISVLREVVEKLHRGEDVDVERALGTGDAVREAEWKECKGSLTYPHAGWTRVR